jgi:hypothetical protein
MMMSQHANKKEEKHLVTGNADRNAEQSVQVSLRLRAVESSERAIVSNITAVQPSAGLVYLDFGFLEHHTIDQISAAARKGESAIHLEGRLECRIAMTPQHVAQLSQQLNQILKSPRPVSTQDAEPLTVGPDTILQ